MGNMIQSNCWEGGRNILLEGGQGSLLWGGDVSCCHLKDGCRQGDAYTQMACLKSRKKVKSSHKGGVGDPMGVRSQTLVGLGRKFTFCSRSNGET